jgi:hypothetical protein
LSRCELTIDQAAVIAEFDDGTPHGTEAVKVLTVTARTQPAHFEHAAQRPRDERTEREIIAASTEELRGKGIAVLSTELIVAAAALTGLRPRADDQSGTWTRKPTLFVALYSGASPRAKAVDHLHQPVGALPPLLVRQSPDRSISAAVVAPRNTANSRVTVSCSWSDLRSVSNRDLNSLGTRSRAISSQGPSGHSSWAR